MTVLSMLRVELPAFLITGTVPWCARLESHNEKSFIKPMGSKYTSTGRAAQQYNLGLARSQHWFSEKSFVCLQVHTNIRSGSCLVFVKQSLGSAFSVGNLAVQELSNIIALGDMSHSSIDRDKRHVVAALPNRLPPPLLTRP